MSDEWKVGYLAREAQLNVFSQASRSYPLLLLAVLLGVVGSVFTAFETQRMIGTIESLLSEGRNVLFVQATQPDELAELSRESCEALSTMPGVDAAGFLIPNGPLSVLPIGDDLPSYRVSSTLISDFSSADVVVGSSLVPDIAPGSRFLVAAGGSSALAVVGAPVREGLRADSSVLVPLRTFDTRSDVCYVLLSRFSNPEEFAPIVTSSLEVAGNPISAGLQLRETSDPVALFLERPGALVFLFLGVLGGLGSAVTIRLRSSEVAVYRLSGTSRRSLLILLHFESLLLGGIMAVSGALAALTLELFGYLLDPLVPVLWSIAAGAIWATIASLLSLDFGLRRPTDLAKDR